MTALAPHDANLIAPPSSIRHFFVFKIYIVLNSLLRFTPFLAFGCSGKDALSLLLELPLWSRPSPGVYVAEQPGGSGGHVAPFALPPHHSPRLADVCRPHPPPRPAARCPLDGLLLNPRNPSGPFTRRRTTYEGGRRRHKGQPTTEYLCGVFWDTLSWSVSEAGPWPLACGPSLAVGAPAGAASWLCCSLPTQVATEIDRRATPPTSPSCPHLPIHLRSVASPRWLAPTSAANSPAVSVSWRFPPRATTPLELCSAVRL